MNIIESFKLAWKSIVGNRLRSFLTMLGMIIGVSSVIILTGLVQGATDFILSTFLNIGPDVIAVSIFSTDTRYVTADELSEFVYDHTDLYREASPLVGSRYEVKKDSNQFECYVLGISPSYKEMFNIPMSSGRYVGYADIKYNANNCVIGTKVVKEIFDGKASLGETLKINGVKYTVVGIHESYDDNYIFIPYTSASKLAGTNQITAYSVAARGEDNVEAAAAALEKFILSKMKDDNFYYIETMKQYLDMINAVKGVMSAALSGIAGISLLVAGIGIMNIMLVSVVERTKEIGIRKSLGAKKKDIIRQFVIEAATISALGGLTGVLFGILTTKGLSNVLGGMASSAMGNVGAFTISISWSSILLAFGVSTGIGIIFGYMPAKKAANLSPIDALRAD